MTESTQKTYKRILYNINILFLFKNNAEFLKLLVTSGSCVLSCWQVTAEPLKSYLSKAVNLLLHPNVAAINTLECLTTQDCFYKFIA